MIAPVSVLLALFLTAGCTFGGVTLISVNPPPPSRPTTLVLGEIQVANPAWTSAPLHFRGRAYDWLTKIRRSTRCSLERLQWFRGQPLDAMGTTPNAGPCP